MVAPALCKCPLGALDPSGRDRPHGADDVVDRLHGLLSPVGRFPRHDASFPGKLRCTASIACRSRSAAASPISSVALDGVEQVGVDLVQPPPQGVQESDDLLDGHVIEVSLADGEQDRGLWPRGADRGGAV